MSAATNHQSAVQDLSPEPVVFPLLDDPVWLADHYLRQNLTLAALAALIGCSESSAARALRAYGLTKPAGARRNPGRWPQLSDRAWLAAQYAQGHTTAMIAADLGAPLSSVQYWRRKHSLTSAPAPKTTARRRPSDATPQAAAELYATPGATVASIAGTLGVSVSTAGRLLTAAGVQRRGRHAQVPAALSDRAALQALVDAGATHAQLAEKFGVGRHRMRKRLRDLGIVAAGAAVPSASLNDKQWLTDRYVTQLRSVRQIADELEVSRGRVTRALRQHQIEVRAVGRTTGVPQDAVPAGVRGSEQSSPLLADPAWMREQYHVRRRSQREIARELGVSQATVSAALRRLGLPTAGTGRPVSRLGLPRRTWTAHSTTG